MARSDCCFFRWIQSYQGIVDGDVITYMTNFGVKLVSTGNSRSISVKKKPPRSIQKNTRNNERVVYLSVPAKYLYLTDELSAALLVIAVYPYLTLPPVFSLKMNRRLA